MREYERFSSMRDERLYRADARRCYLRHLEGGCARTASRHSAHHAVEWRHLDRRERGERPIGLLLSGPAGGVIGGRWTGEACDKQNVITIDIGGTSADISVMQDGEVADQEPARHGGGTSAGAGADDRHRRDRRGRRFHRLYRSPAARSASARARPARIAGPACYGKGGTEPAVTDAQVVLGRLDPGAVPRRRPRRSTALAHRRSKSMWPSRSACQSRDAALGILRDRQQQHGAGDQRQFGRQGHRSAQLHADGLRRRRAAACRRPGGDDRREGHDLAACIPASPRRWACW